MTMTGCSVLITGGTGSFGQAFAAHALAKDARRVLIYSRGEAQQAAMAAKLQDPRIRFIIGDVRDGERLTDACRGVDVVIHAAALKRVEVCEREPREALLTNVIGTQQVAKAAIANGVGRCILLSTDKAAAPHTLYGVTKLAAERLWLNANVLAAGTPTRFSATRYGNVLGSTGSVLPRWRAQHEAGEPLTITGPSASRFWMRMTTAVDLVDQALRAMRSGEIFIPKIGAAPLRTLVEAAVPEWKGSAIGAAITGLGAGEKMHEVLITEGEARTTYDCGSYYVIEPAERTWRDDVAPLLYPLVERDFTYSSDTANQLTVDQLRGMIE